MKFLRSTYHYALALIGNILFGFPSRKITIIGITGTKGKSTTAELLSAIFESAGYKTALLGTVRRKVGSESFQNRGNTMPGRFAVQRFLRDAVRARCTHAFLEVSSQGVLQHRHRFIAWDAGVFLNLAPEHIESHGSYEAYRDAKVTFFRDTAKTSLKERKHFFVNARDREKGYFTTAVQSIPGCTVHEFDAAQLAGDPAFRGSWVATDFNFENSAAAFEVSRVFGVPDALARKTLSEFPGVPGRMEVVQREPFQVIVDYAHTPDSLKSVYAAVRRSVSPPARMVCVLGAAAGGRDVWKRSVMGTIAAELCDEVIVTTEDPFDEPPSKIAEDIESGFKDARPRRASKTERILDRRSAIRSAIARVRPGDAVILTGKGSESSIRIAGGRSLPWNERAEAESALRDSVK